MRNLLLFVLFLIGLFYVRRALRRGAGGRGGAAGSRADGGRAAAEDSRRVLDAEQMVACAHCGLHVPESESVRGSGEFFCSDEHRRLGVRR